MSDAGGKETIERFAGAAAARKYAASLPGTAVDRRERRAIGRALAGVPDGARVLDLPCGAGRLVPFLAGLGMKVTAADSSPHMTALAARESAGSLAVADALRTPFRDRAFDAVICNRLLHHFADPELRRAALRELSRVCRGPLVVSFFRDLGWDALVFRLRCLVRGRRPADRIPIPLAALRADAEAAGLAITAVLGARPLVSKQWYAVLGVRA